MKKVILSALVALYSFGAAAQEINQDLRSFRKIIASSRINVVLSKGDEESIRLVYNNVSRNKINILVKGKTLHLFLDDARSIEKTVRRYDDHGPSRHGIYRDVDVTAYVTYRALDMVEIRGQQELSILDGIDTDKFVVRAYGENDITLESLQTEFFKAVLYGRNTLKIREGNAGEQKYRLYGENKIDTRAMTSDFASTSIFGEGKVKLNSREEVRVNAFGEPRIFVDGGANVYKCLVIGRTRIVEQ